MESLPPDTPTATVCPLVYHVIFVHSLAHNAGEIVEDFVHRLFPF
jgi:hypothetical protein